MAAIAVMMGLLLIGTFMWWSSRDAANATVAQSAIAQVAFTSQSEYRRFGAFETDPFRLKDLEPGYSYVGHSRRPTEISVVSGVDAVSGVNILGIAAADGSEDRSRAGVCYLYKLAAPGSGQESIAQTIEYGGDTGVACAGSAALTISGNSTWGLDSE